jgi:glycogen debranching enzyme
MDAKVEDWVVTPRRGKAVEINALWYNALRLMADWADHAGDPDGSLYRTRAETVHDSFNRRFWCDSREHLYDVVDGEPGPMGRTDDPSCRPNQMLAIALPHAVLTRERWPLVMRAVRAQLLTPVGLRSLAPAEPEFKSRYYGDLRARDAAYHQGTVWGWLVGPFVDAWLKVHPDDVDGARRAIDGFAAHLSDACVGSVSEIFDADAPFTPRGCVAQAWSVAELLRVHVALERRTAEPWRPFRERDERGALR